MVLTQQGAPQLTPDQIVTNSDAYIERIKTELKLTPEQEKNWGSFSSAMHYLGHNGAERLNLRVAREEADMESGLRYLEGIVALDPDSSEDRFLRAVVRLNKGLKNEALEDANYLVNHLPPGAALNRAQQLKKAIERDLGD